MAMFAATITGATGATRETALLQMAQAMMASPGTRRSSWTRAGVAEDGCVARPKEHSRWQGQRSSACFPAMVVSAVRRLWALKRHSSNYKADLRAGVSGP